MTIDDLNRMIAFFNVFKETSANEIGIIRGFANWTYKMSYSIEGGDLRIHVPPVLVKRGTPEIISHSRRKPEVDEFMKRKKYTYLEYVIKRSIDIFAQKNEKKVTSMSVKKGQ